MSALVHGTCFHCLAHYFARVDEPNSPEPRCPGCGQPLRYLLSHLRLHILWQSGEPTKPLHTLIAATMAALGRDIVNANDVPPLPPPTTGGTP
jgi:hypothetical protein